MFLHITKDKYIRKMIFISGGLGIALVFVIFYKFGPLRDTVILHYDIFKGIDLLGSKNQLYGMLAASIIFTFIDFALSDFLYERERFFSYILAFGGVILMALSFLAAIILAAVN